MGTVNIQNVSKQFGGQIVLDNVSVELHSGEIVGMVGPNGAGKTTLFRLITGQIEPDLGTVTRSRGMDVGYLPQEPEVGLDNALHDEVLSVFADVFALERKQQALSEQMARRHDGPELDELMKQYDRVTAERVARRVANPALRDMFPLSGDYRIIEVVAPAHLHHKSLLEAKLRKEFDLLVLAVRPPSEEQFHFLPRADTIIKPDEVLMVLGRELDLARFADLR